MANEDDLLKDVKDYFADRFEKHGKTPAGLDYNSPGAQAIRFDQLLKLIGPPGDERFSLNDYGCGFGSLAHYMVEEGYVFDYVGFDIVEDYVKAAKKTIPSGLNWQFTTSYDALQSADYTIACGVFNLKFEASVDQWQAYVLESIHKLAAISKRGFAFNTLTGYSEEHYKRERTDLYYPDVCFIFDYCVQNFSRRVALLHDYEVWDATYIVRLG